ncbi:integral membrane protein [Penicillium malachiteum]|uniref:Integral membrane protein n=1 Tax=Penicillium malachiteum TaxID=1324776 RepID=A0AAD6HH76_9EURO|nr:integral membrane protein [Penicillium malachiteum]
MPRAQSPRGCFLSLAATLFATIFIAFGINACIRPTHALSFFSLEPPAGAADQKLVDSLMAVYGVRDIFMGLVIYIATVMGTPRSLGWTLILTSLVAFADGVVCWTHGHGHWDHWGYAPIILVIGVLALGSSSSKSN